MNTIITKEEEKRDIKPIKTIERKPVKNYVTKARKVIRQNWRMQLYETIYRYRKPQSRVFATLMLFLILLHSTAVILETVETWDRHLHKVFIYVQWSVTILFTIEYFLRIIALPRPSNYIFSPIGILDFLSIFPFYLGFFGFPKFKYLTVIRLARLFRIFQVFNLISYQGEAGTLVEALKASRFKITIFILAVIISVTIIGATMFVIEGPEHGFANIPTGIYWAVVTITTVGYGDIAPQTPWGKTLATILMLMGYSTIVVPTSIVSAEIAKRTDKKNFLENKTCFYCGLKGHDSDAQHCKRCGSKLWGDLGDDDDDL